MLQQNLIPHLFRTEYRKIVSVLAKLFGLEHIDVAEDIVSDTFLLASETWGIKGIPENPTAWLYTVSKNKAKDYLKRDKLFGKVTTGIRQAGTTFQETEIDLSNQNIYDSQLQMIFAICHPSISSEAQVGLALNLLGGFGAEEIADAFLSNKELIYKRLSRAKEKLREEQIKLELPQPVEISKRLEPVLTTIYLLFNEGYYSSSQNMTLRKDLCLEAMRLTYLLLENESTNVPSVNALLSLMCFHSSRFEARTNSDGGIILYEDQDTSLWNRELIDKGEFYLNLSAQGTKATKYHLEAAIAYWHTHKSDIPEKWENILQLYNQLLQLEYSPIAALNRTYALAKANGKEEAIREAEKLGLTENHLYHSLLANLYSGLDDAKSMAFLKSALNLAKTIADEQIIKRKIKDLEKKGMY